MLTSNTNIINNGGKYKLSTFIHKINYILQWRLKMIEIEIIQGDITRLQVDAIVNAANCSLLGGGGVDGAIHRAAGPELLKACIPLNGCETGQAKITPGFKLPAKFVIHTPGPIYRDGLHGEPALLESCYRSCLELAEQNSCETVAFPAISAGVYGYPKKAATEISVKTVRGFATQKVKKVIFCCFSEEMEEIYRRIVANLKQFVFYIK